MLDKTLEQMLQYVNVNEDTIKQIEIVIDDFAKGKISSLDCTDKIANILEQRKERLK